MTSNISDSTDRILEQSISVVLNEETIHLNQETMESKYLKIVKYSVVILGVLWGVPWIESCYQALEKIGIYD